MGIEVGSKVYRAEGGLVWGLGSDTFYIGVGTLTQMVGSDGRRLIQHGTVYVPASDEWRATKAEAIADVRAALGRRAANVEARIAEIEREGGAA